tara:strand:+ start:272 stop:1171 length:900 start_codon:yes stop_codon:yes gene_type:complete
MKNNKFKNIKNYKIIFFGSESAGLRCLKFLVKQNNITISHIITNEKGLSFKAFLKIAKKNNITITSKVNLLKEIKSSIHIKEEIDFILSVFSPFIVEDEILKISRFGGFNLHPGKLPEYAGLNPTSWSIYNNEQFHEVTLHKMTNIIDGGDILNSKKIEITKEETAISLINKSTIEGMNLIKEFFETISQKSINEIAMKKQDFKKRNYYSKINPLLNPLNWNFEIEEIDRIFRSTYFGPNLSPWGSPKAIIKNKLVELTNYEIVRCEHSIKIGEVKFITNHLIEIACKNGIIKAEIIYK